MPPMQYSSQEGAESSVAQPATPFSAEDEQQTRPQVSTTHFLYERQ